MFKNLKISLIPEWKQFYKLYSIWVFVLIAIIPDLYALAIEMDMIEGDLINPRVDKIIKTIAFIGAGSRLIKQKVQEVKNEKDYDVYQYKVDKKRKKDDGFEPPEDDDYPDAVR